MRATEDKEAIAILKSIAKDIKEIKAWLQSVTIYEEAKPPQTRDEIIKFADDFYETVLKPMKEAREERIKQGKSRQ